MQQGRIKRQVAAMLAATAMVASAPAADARRDKPQYANLASDVLAREGADALRDGDAARAIGAFGEMVSRNPRDGSGQTFLALSYHLAARQRPEAVDLAMTGYDLAMRVDPGQMWPAAMAGRAAYDRGSYGDATEYFARAVTLRPGDPRLLGGLAASAYMNGDAALATTAADRAAALAPNDPAMLRLAAMAAAAAGREAVARDHLARLAARSQDSATATTDRVTQITATASIDAEQAAVAAEGPGADLVSDAPSQVSVDIAIVLSQNTQRERTGINLLDGLSLQYGTNRTSTRTFRQSDGGPVGNEYQRVLTGAIGIPQLNYSLNLFNRGGQFYSVVARPQLTAYRGEQSEFFVGRTLKVAVNGINNGSLEQIDIGIEMKVTPIEITATGTRVKIEAGRSFLTADQAGTFNEALTTFRQKVIATAEIKFGETLLLSGLNETVDDMTFSKTPILGDMPVVGNLFNQKNKTQRRDAVLVLVTPSRPAALPGRSFARGDHAARLAELWTRLVDPISDASATQARLGRMWMFTRMTRGDVSMPFPSASEAAGEMLRDLFLPGSN